MSGTLLLISAAERVSDRPVDHPGARPQLHSGKGEAISQDAGRVNISKPVRQLRHNRQTGSLLYAPTLWQKGEAVTSTRSSHTVRRLSLLSLVAMLGAFAAVPMPAQADDASDGLARSKAADTIAVPIIPSERREIDVSYNGYFIGLRVMKAVVEFDQEGDDYAVDAGFRTAGLLGFFNDSEINAKARGEAGDAGLQPRSYEHRNLKSSKNRVIRIHFEDGVARPDVNPPFGSAGDPAPTEEHLSGAFDPLTTLMAISFENAGCGKTVPVFDGKQRYDLRFTDPVNTNVRVRGYDGPAVRCHVFYTPVAGFDPEDLAEPGVYERPFEIWVPTREGVPRVPVRIRGDVSGLSVAVEARDITERTTSAS